jgi:hypothetical protein
MIRFFVFLGIFAVAIAGGVTTLLAGGRTEIAVVAFCVAGASLVAAILWRSSQDTKEQLASARTGSSSSSKVKDADSDDDCKKTANAVNIKTRTLAQWKNYALIITWGLLWVGASILFAPSILSFVYEETGKPVDFIIRVAFTIAMALVLVGYFVGSTFGDDPIPIAHRGVPVFLEKPWPWFVFDAGYFSKLLPWPFMTVKVVDVRRISIPIRDFSDSDTAPLNAMSKDGIEMFPEGQVSFRVVNPLASLHAQSLEDIIEQLGEAVRTVLRSKIISHTHLEIMGNDKFCEELIDDLQHEADKKMIDWGVDVEAVLVSQILPADKVIAASQKKVIEKHEADAEKIELERFGKRVATFAVKQGVSFEEANWTGLAQQGKAERKELRIPGLPELAGALLAHLVPRVPTPPPPADKEEEEKVAEKDEKQPNNTKGNE